MYCHANNPAGGVRSPSAPTLQKRIIRIGNICLGVSEGNSLTLTGTDQNGSLLWSRNINSCKGTVHSWSPYGSAQPADASLPGFNGERIDPVSGTYHLGNGYRTYNPVLMRFNCPDSLSPFGAGGINPYAYCAGDPVNHTDPSGHLSWQAILGITLGATGLAAAVFTGGMSIVAAGGVALALSSASTTALVIGGLGVVADVTAIASGAMEDSDPEASSALGWVSLATGLIGGVTGLAGLGKSIKGVIKDRGSYNLTKAAKTTGYHEISHKGIWSAASMNMGFSTKIFGNEIITSGGKIVRNARGEIKPFALGYVSNLRKTGEPALIVHGDQFRLAFIQGSAKRLSTFNVYNIDDMKIFAEVIMENFHINLAADKMTRLHLIACMTAGEIGTAQRLANVIKRPVVAYGKAGQRIRTFDVPIMHSSDVHVTREIGRRFSVEELKATTYYSRRISYSNHYL